MSFHSSQYSSYTSGTVIPKGQGPPPALLTQYPNRQVKQNILPYNQSRETDTKSVNSFPENFGKRPMLTVDPLYDQHIIKPPKANVTHGRIPYTEVISSDDRNYRLYPGEGNYVVKLKDEYRDVTSVTLFNASIPNTAYLIGNRNNRIYFQEVCGETIIVELPVGDYTPVSLVTAVQDALNAGGVNTYTVTLNSLTNKFEISSDLATPNTIFKLIFFGGSEPFGLGDTRATYISRSVGRVLGYNRKDYLYASGTATTTSGSTTIIGSGDSNYTEELTVGENIYLEDIGQTTEVVSITSDTEFETKDVITISATGIQIAKGTHKAPNKFDLSSDAYIVLEIPELENVKANTSHLDRAFAVIPMVFPHNTKNFVVSTSSGVSPYRKYFNPPLPKLDRLTIRFRDVDGNIVNFNGIQNFMEFKVVTMNAPGFYDPGSIN